MSKKIKAGVLEVAYEESGPPDGTPVILLHGFPYDVHAYDDVARILAGEGRRVIVPYLRGYGPTRFLSDKTPRSGQQAVLAHDLRDLMDALGLQRALLGGFDWGGRSCCIAAALWPGRVMGVVLGGGYTIQDIAASGTPIFGREASRRSVASTAGSPGTRPKRWRYECTTTSTKSGLSNDFAVRAYVASSNFQFGDHMRQSNLPSS